MGERPAGVFGENPEENAQKEEEKRKEEKLSTEKEKPRKDKEIFLLKRMKTFYLNGYRKISSFKRADRKFRRFSSQ